MISFLLIFVFFLREGGLEGEGGGEGDDKGEREGGREVRGGLSICRNNINANSCGR